MAMAFVVQAAAAVLGTIIRAHPRNARKQGKKEGAEELHGSSGSGGSRAVRLYLYRIS